MLYRRIERILGLALAIVMVLLTFVPSAPAVMTSRLVHKAVVAVNYTTGRLTDILTGVLTFSELALDRFAANLSHFSAVRIYMDTGTRQSLLPVALSDDSPYRWAIWSSNNQTVAAISQDGQLTANSIGIATITAQTDTGSYLKICTVYVSQPYTVINDGTYLIESGADGCFLTADHDNAGASVLAESFDLFKYQRFRIENIGGNRFRIRSARSNQGLQLTMNSDGQVPAAGMEIDLMADSAGWIRQVWTATRHWNDTVSIISEADSSLALSCPNSSNRVIPVVLDDYSPAPGQLQQWHLTPVSPVFAHEIDGCWPLAQDLPLSIWMWPVPSTTNVSSSQPSNAYNYSVIDIEKADVDDTGALVIAAQSGHVTYRGITAEYGMVIIMQSEIGGTIYHTFYGGLINHYIPAWIRAGSYVHKGDIIGRIGATNPTGPARLIFGVKTGGTGDSRTGTPLDPLSRIFKWNEQLEQPFLQLNIIESGSYTLQIAAAFNDPTKLYLTASLISCTGDSRDANAQIARSIYSRLPVSPGIMDLQVRATGLVPLGIGQKYVLMLELEDLSTGRSANLGIDFR